MKKTLMLLLVAITLLSACAPATAVQPTVPAPTSSPTVTITPTQLPTNTPRPTSTPNYPITIQTPISNIQPITKENVVDIRPLFRLMPEGSQSIFKIAGSGPRHPLWVFSADMSHVAFVQPNTVSFTDIAGTGKSIQSLRLTGQTRPWSDGAFLKDNKFLALGQGSLSLFDLASGNELKKTDLYCCLNKKLFLMPDGERALVPSRTGLDLYDLVKLKRIQGYDAPGNSSMVWDASPDGKLLATAGERNPIVFIFDVEKAVVLRTLTVERFPAVNVKFFPDGKQLMLTDELGAFKLVQFWDMETGKKTREIQLTDEMLSLPANTPFRVASVVIHPSGKFFVMAISSSSPLLVFWETNADKPFAVMDMKSKGIPSFNYATKTDFMEFIDESRLLIIDKIWGVVP